MYDDSYWVKFRQCLFGKKGFKFRIRVSSGLTRNEMTDPIFKDTIVNDIFRGTLRERCRCTMEWKPVYPRLSDLCTWPALLTYL